MVKVVFFMKMSNAEEMCIRVCTVLASFGKVWECSYRGPLIDIHERLKNNLMPNFECFQMNLNSSLFTCV